MADPRRIFKENRRNPGYCLVIRPMQKEFNDFWNAVAEEFREVFAWTDVGRLDGSGEIMNEVLAYMARTDVVIADVSEGSANVFYELGIAHALKGPEKVVIVTRVKGDQPSSRDVPFDVAGMRFLRYESGSTPRREFIESLKQLILKALEGTTWFHLAAGATHRVPSMAGDDGNYNFDVTAKALLGSPEKKDEAIEIEVTVYPDPSNRGSKKPQSLQTTLHYRDMERRTVRVPHLPWRLKSEGIDQSPPKHTICMIPDIPAKKTVGRRSAVAALAKKHPS
jgi:hypothetical protein